MKNSKTILAAIALTALAFTFFACSSESAPSGPNDGGISSSAEQQETQCRDSQNRVLYCNWTTGCYAIDPTYAEPPGGTCEEHIANCQRYGTLYVNVSEEGAGISCIGVPIGGSSSSRSSSSFVQSSSSVYVPPPSSSSTSPTWQCGTQTYNPSTQFCSGSTIYTKCGGNEYTPSTHFCFANNVYELCGGEEYLPTAWNVSCVNGVLYTLMEDERDDQTYKTVKIGTQIWMAENLNYNVSGSKCPDNVTANCATYGRQYNWATAMALNTSYNSTLYGTASAKHKGICPTGWHLPSDAEWETLKTYVGTTPGTKLKATNGWKTNANGTNTYGFTALPGGYVEYGSIYDSYPDIGDRGVWWTATEYNASYARNKSMDGGSSVSNFGIASYDYSIPKNYMLSVRCVQD